MLRSELSYNLSRYIAKYGDINGWAMSDEGFKKLDVCIDMLHKTLGNLADDAIMDMIKSSDLLDAVEVYKMKHITDSNSELTRGIHKIMLRYIADVDIGDWLDLFYSMGDDTQQWRDAQLAIIDITTACASAHVGI